MLKKMCIMIFALLVILVTQARAYDNPKQGAGRDKQTFPSLIEAPIVVETGRSYWYGLVVGATTGLAGSLLSTVMIQNWELNAPQSGFMFGMPIGMAMGSARGVAGWGDSVDGKALLASRIGALTPVLIGGALGRLIVADDVKGIRNGVFTGQFLAPFGAMVGYRLYQAVFVEREPSAITTSITASGHRVVSSHLRSADADEPQADFTFQLIAMEF